MNAEKQHHHAIVNIPAIPVFWFLVMILASFFSMLHQFLIGSESVPSFDLRLTYFIAQAPAFLFVVVLHIALEKICAYLPGRLATLSFFLATALLFLTALAFFVASEYNFRAFGTYLTFDVFRVLFTDFFQIILSVWHDSKLSVLTLLFVSLASWYALRALRGIQVPRFSKPTIALIAVPGILTTAVCGALVISEPLQPTLPVTYAATALVKRWADNQRVRLAYRPVDLKPILPIEHYRETNPAPRSTPPVFIIMLESISSDHAGFTGYHRAEITPSIDALAADSLAFVNTYATSSHSNYSQTSAHASQYARRRNYLDAFQDVEYPRTLLFDILGLYGYQTAFVSSQNENWLGMLNFVRSGSKIDFFFHSPSALGQNIPSQMKLEDAFTRSVAENFIRNRDQDRPLFLYLNFQKTHFPYDLPDGETRYYSPAEIDFDPYTFLMYPQEKLHVVQNRYDNALRYVDKQVGLFIKFLKAEGLYDEAIIVLAVDHGEAFYKHGFPTHCTTVFDDQIKTFLLVKLPHSELRGIREDAVSIVDINPSVLEIMGLPNHDNFQGEPIIYNPVEDRNLFVTAQVAIHADAVVDFPWKLIAQGESTVLFNLERDPSETVDFSREFPQKRQELERSLQNHIEAQLGYYANRNLTARFYPPEAAKTTDKDLDESSSDGMIETWFRLFQHSAAVESSH